MLRREQGHQFVAPVLAYFLHQGGQRLTDSSQLLLRRHTIGTQRGNMRLHLVLQPGQAHHNKFIQVGVKNGKKFDTLQQWMAIILRFLEDTPVELNPAQVAIDIQFRPIQLRNLGRSHRARGHMLFFLLHMGPYSDRQLGPYSDCPTTRRTAFYASRQAIGKA